MSYQFSTGLTGAIGGLAGLSQQAYGQAMWNAQTATITTSAATNAYAFFSDHAMPLPTKTVIDDSDEVAWLKRRIKEIEWKA